MSPCPKALLNADATAKLVDELLAALVRREGAPDNERSKSLAWAFVHVADVVSVASSPSGLPHAQVEVTTPQGALNHRRRLPAGRRGHRARPQGRRDTELAGALFPGVGAARRGRRRLLGSRRAHLAPSYIAGFVLDDDDLGVAIGGRPSGLSF